MGGFILLGAKPTLQCKVGVEIFILNLLNLQNLLFLRKCYASEVIGLFLNLLNLLSPTTIDNMGLPTSDLGSAFWLALAGVLSAMLGVMLQYCYKSKCKSFQICCLKIERDTTAEVQEDIEQMHTAKKPDE